MQPLSSKEILERIVCIIDEKKGFHIMALDVRGFSNITDYMVIAEGNVDRHVSSICQTLKKSLSELGIELLYAEGVKAGDWAVLDFGGIMVHLFSPTLREHYALERLWEGSKIVEIDLLPKKACVKSNFSIQA